MFAHSHHHWAYVWIPFFGSVIWFSTLLAMLITWLAQGQPRLPSQDESIVYISDIGADILKPLFITGCSITAVSFFLSLAIERWLRHSGRLVADMRRRESVFGCLAVVSSLIGGCGLVLLSVFDTQQHPTIHRAFLLVFMLGVVASAIFTVVEFRWLSKDFKYVRTLRIAYIAKATIASILVILAIAFAVALYTAPNAGAILEWTIAFGFCFYLLTFYFDLRDSKGVHKGILSKEQMREHGRAYAMRR